MLAMKKNYRRTTTKTNHHHLHCHHDPPPFTPTSIVFRKFCMKSKLNIQWILACTKFIFYTNANSHFHYLEIEYAAKCTYVVVLYIYNIYLYWKRWIVHERTHTHTHTRYLMVGVQLLLVFLSILLGRSCPTTTTTANVPGLP